MAGMFADLEAPQPRSAPGMFADLGGAPQPMRSAPPALLRKPPPRPSWLKRAATNAAAAFYGSDGDSAGLASEALIDWKGGDLRKRDARANRGFANLLSTVGVDALSRSVTGWSPSDALNRVASGQAIEAQQKARAFALEQARRRQAVVDLGPARGFGDVAADFGGRIAASLPQPENFVGGPSLKGATLGGKFLRAGSAAAAANLATEPVLQVSAVNRGTRDRLSARDAAVNTAVAFGTGGVFGAGAHAVEKLKGRKGSATTPPGMFADLVDGAEPPSPPLEIPDLGSLSTDLREAREEIDEVDRELLALLARRVELARLAGRAKRELGHPVHDPVREAALLQRRRGWAKASGLDEAQVEAVFRALLQLARGAQSDR